MLYPLPAVLIGCRDEEGRDNLMTAAWAGTVCSDPVMVSVSIRKERHSHDIIERTGEFTLSLTTQKLAFATDYCGVKSGRDTDKFREMKLTPLESAGISVNVDDEYLDENGRLVLEKAGLIAYSHGEYFTLGEKIGKFGYSVRRKPGKAGNAKGSSVSKGVKKRSWSERPVKKYKN